jgi:hypothetical protein
MENSNISRRSVAFGIALSVAGLVNSIIVVLKEKNAAVMNGLKSVLGHHWTTHSAIVLVLFLGLGVALGIGKGAGGSTVSAGRLIGIIGSSVVVAALVIVGFYLVAD